VKPGLYVVVMAGPELFPYSREGECGDVTKNVTPRIGDVMLLLGIKSKYAPTCEDRPSVLRKLKKFEVCLYRDALMEIDPEDVRKCMKCLKSYARAGDMVR
jgi:hypothetical protein